LQKTLLDGQAVGFKD